MFNLRITVSFIVLISFLIACNQSNQLEDNQIPLFNAGDLDNATVLAISSEKELVGIDLNNEELTKEIGETEDQISDENSELVSQAVLPAVDGYLAYYRVNGNTYQIWIANQSNDQKTLVYSSSYEIQSVAVSGDGNWVAASIKNQSGKYDVYLIDIALAEITTSNMFNLTNSGSKDEIDVSITATGSYIAYSKPTNAGISKINVCGFDSNAYSCSMSILAANDDQVQATLSGNGQYIALIRKLANGRDRVLVYDMTANTYTSVISRPEPLSHPSISNDGSTVMYLRDRTSSIGKYLVRVANLSTQTLQNELSSTGLDHPHITADKMYFAYKGQAGANSRAFTRNIQTNDRASAAGGTWDYGGAYWQKVAGESGAFDPSFGNNGVTITDWSGDGDTINAMVIDADGKIVVAGYSTQNNQKDFAIARYHSNGILDTSFGNNGGVTTDFFGQDDIAYAITIDADEKIIVVGSEGTNFPDSAIAVYNPDGSLDTSFSSDGKQTHSVILDPRDHVARAVAVDGDNKIIIAGDSGDFFVARFLRSGQVDWTFEGYGAQAIDFFGGDDGVYGLELDKDGKIVLAGFAEDVNNEVYKFGLLRLDSDGKLDAGFGNNGKTTTSFPLLHSFGRSLTLSDSGDIFVTGYSRGPQFSSDDGIAISKYTSDGNLDTSFGNQGKVSYDTGYLSDDPRSIAIDTQGKLIVGGYAGASYAGPPGRIDFFLTRFTSDGSLDTSFGDGGLRTYELGVDPNDWEWDRAYAMALDSDGKIIMGGYRGSRESERNFALARFHP